MKAPSSAKLVVSEPERDPALRLSPHGHPGRLITLCGVDGSGKTTTGEAVRQHAVARGWRPMLTQIPTPYIRDHALFRRMVCADADGARVDVNLFAVCLILLGDLRQHLTEVVEPRLRDGQVVICDRYMFTHLAEIMARSPNPRDAEVVAAVAHRFPMPDLAIFMDVGADVAAERVLARGDAADRPAHRALAEAQVRAYRRVAATNGLLTISSEQPIENALEGVRAALDRCFAAQKNQDHRVAVLRP